MAENELEVLAEIRRIAAEELDWKNVIEPSHELIRDLQLDSLGLLLTAEFGGCEMTLLVGVSVLDEIGRSLAPVPHMGFGGL